jgi:rubrerythrin
MSKTKRSRDSKRKAKHYGLMVKHAKKSNDKKKMELFRQLIEERRKIETQSENIVNADEVGVDIDVDVDDINQIMTDAVVDAVNESVPEVENLPEIEPSTEG